MKTKTTTTQTAAKTGPLNNVRNAGFALFAAACFTLFGATGAFAQTLITGTIRDGEAGAWNPSGPVTGSNFVIKNADAGSTAGGGVTVGGSRAWIVSNGTISFNRTTGNAGGMRLQTSTTLIGSYLVFEGNVANGASSTGGGIGMSDANAVIILSYSDFTRNLAASNGGGIRAGSNGIIITGSYNRFIGNIAGSAGANADGGGIIYNSTGLGLFHQTAFLFDGNSATRNGGGVYLSGAVNNLEMTSGTFKNNVAGSNGGGLYYDATPGGYSIFSNLLFTSNTSNSAADGNGGGAIFANKDFLITSSTFQNNVAVSRGGAIRINTLGTTLTGNNLYFSGNSADVGGAIFAAGDFSGTNTIFVSNTANRGGAIGALSAATINLYYTEDASLTGNTSTTGTGGFAYLESDAVLNFDIAAGKTVTVGGTNGGSTVDSIASDASATVLKSGSGTLILKADSSLYSGTTRVTTNGGSLLLGHGDAKLGGLVIAESGAAFGGQGVATGDVTLQNNSSLVIGMDHNAGAIDAATFTIDGTLTLNGASLKFDVINATTSEQLAVGDIVFAGGQNYIDLNMAQSGVYTLINLTSAAFATSATEAFITTKNGEALSARIDQAYSLTDSGTKLVLTLAKNSYARTWTGASALWNATAENWTGADGVDQLFLDGDKVLFNDSASLKSVSLPVSALASEMTVDTNDIYTFTGAAIQINASSAGNTDGTFGAAPTGKLIKDGTGTLILDNAANTFTGGITLNSGTLQGNTVSLGSHAITSAANTAVVLNQTVAGTYTGTILGTAAFIKAGAATLTLSRASQFASSAAIGVTAGILDTASLDQSFANLYGTGTIDTGAIASTLALDSAATSTFGGVIAGNASIEKTGAATLILAGDNTYAGITTITGGTLQLGAGAAPGSVLGTIVNNSALTVDHGTFSSTLAATLDGAGSFTKFGTGALALTADSSGYLGATHVSAGALMLNVANASLGGSITVSSTGALGGIGSATGNVSIATGGAIIAGNAHNNVSILAPETFNIDGTLTLADKSILKFDLFSNSRSDLITVGALSLTGTGIIDLNSVSTGTYTLITSTADLTINTGDLLTMQNGNIPSSRTSDSYSISDDNKSLLLTIETANLYVIWAGTTSNVWAALVDNWDSADNQFVGADNVTFGAMASGTTIDIGSNGVLVSDMTVNSPNDYTFTGGVINTTTAATGFTGTGKLIKDGAGALVFNNSAAIFIGGIDILQGTVEGSTATLNVGATGTITNNATLVFNQDAAATYSSPIVGTGSLAKTGTGALTLDNAANTYAGGISVDDGSLTLLNSGTATRSAINIGAGALLSVNGAASYNFGHALAGSGTFAVSLASQDGRFNLDTTAMGSSYAGVLQLGTGSLALNTGSALATTSLVLGAGNITTVASGTHTFQSLTLDHSTLIFTTTVPADKNALGVISVVDLDISKEATVKLGIPADIPMTLPDSSRNLLEQDDITDGVLLVAVSGSITGEGTLFFLKDQNGGDIDVTVDRTISINRSATDTTKVADAVYGYKVGANNVRDGLYLGYSLLSLEVVEGETLELAARAGADAAGSNFNAAINGLGNVRLDASNAHNATITIGAENNYAGETQIVAGTVKAAADNGFGNTIKLGISVGATADIDGYSQGIRSLDNAGTLAIGTGILTIHDGGSSTGALLGATTGLLNLANNATLDIKGANPGFHASVQHGSGTEITMDNSQGLGDGRIEFASESKLTVTNGGVLANTLGSTSPGAGTLVKSGSGALILTANSSSYSGQVDVHDGEFVLKDGARLGANASINFMNPAARVVYDNIQGGNLGQGINNPGILALRNNSSMTLDRSLADYIVELRSSSLTFAHNDEDEETFQTITVKNLVGTGTINFHVNFGREKTDKLIITDAAAGADDDIVLTVNRASNRRSNPDSTIELITGADSAATYTLAGEELLLPDGNIFKLYQGGPNKNIADPSIWYIAASNQMGHAIDAIVNNAALLAVDWQLELESLNKRMGEVRRELFAGGAPSGGNLWINGHAYKINGSDKLVKNDLLGYGFEQKAYGVTAGGDKIFRMRDSALLAGLFAGMTAIDRDFDNHGDGKTDAVNGGLYLTWMHQKGFYTDIAVKFDSYKNSFNARVGGGSVISADYTTTSIGASAEAGYHISAASGWWCEPSVQVGYMKLRGNDYIASDNVTGSGMEVSKAGTTALQYRTMIRVGKTFGSKLNAYLKAALARNNDRDGEIVVSVDGEVPSNPIRLDIDGVRTEFGIGASYALGARSQLWVDYEYAKAANYSKPWSFSAGYRFAW